MSTAASPRWFFGFPRESVINAFLAAQAAQDFRYAEVGISRDDAVEPKGYNLDHNRVRLGQGADCFNRACAALRRWAMFPAPWTRISPADAALREGQIVAMQANALGVWWLNACRIVYVIDQDGPIRRFGFAYGTLPAHVEEGEERFSVEFHGDGGVWYDLRAFSRPRYWPVRLAKPVARRLQRRFVLDSQQAMRRAVGG